MRKLNEVIIHCSATHPDWMIGRDIAEKVGEIRRWHISPPRNWSDIGYHYVIDRNGKAAPGRPMGKDGAHVKGRNSGTVGVCLLGGHGAAATDSFTDHFTDAQRVALLRLLEDFPGLPVTGHNQYANKGCPGFHVPSTLRAWRTSKPAKEPAKEYSFEAISKKYSLEAIFQAIINAITRLFK